MVGIPILVLPPLGFDGTLHIVWLQSQLLEEVFCGTGREASTTYFNWVANCMPALEHGFFHKVLILGALVLVGDFQPVIPGN